MALKAWAKRIVASAAGPGMEGLRDRIARLERMSGARAAGPPLWRGTLDHGRALGADGREHESLTRAYREQLREWVQAARATAPHSAQDGNDPPCSGLLRSELAAMLGPEAQGGVGAWCAGRSVVELGAGPCPAVSAAPWRRAVVVDPLAEGFVAEDVWNQRWSGQVTLIAAGGERLPLPSATFDLAIGGQGLRRMGDPLPVLLEIRRVLRPGALLWLRDPDGPVPAPQAPLQLHATSVAIECGFIPVRERPSGGAMLRSPGAPPQRAADAREPGA